ncbi:MAG: hypothetical protein HKN82_06665 [Akkermansiaceae bacterium]|nr:hypothetical protein [Akkermansiaceae bacterium]NNM29749.1 hypothetical protein [Akkermansiaceae bacterium]
MKYGKWLAATAGAVLLIAVIFGGRYLAGSWAPSFDKGGLRFPARPELRDVHGAALSAEELGEFVRMCGELRSTSRDIGEDRGSGFLSLHFPGVDTVEFLTIYGDRNVVFPGWWIDAKTYSMMGRRAPCFELSGELERFIREHELMTSSEKQLPR